MARPKLFSPLILLDQMNARVRLARELSLIHRCQERQPSRVFLTELAFEAHQRAQNRKTGKPVCYNVCVGGNSAAALFDIEGD